MVTRNTYIIAVIVAIIAIVAISVFVLNGTPVTPPYSTTTTTTTTGPTSSTTTPTSSNTTSTSTTTTTTTSQGAAATTVTLVAQDFRFNTTNPTITVKAGQQVTFTVVNKDGANHTFDIQGVSGGSTGQIGPGETKTLTVTLSAGTYKYLCADHPGQMNGQIVAQ